MVALIFLLQYALVQNAQRSDLAKNNVSPAITPVSTLPRCAPAHGSSCITFAYTGSNDPLTTQLMGMIAQENGIPNSEIMPFLTAVEVDDYLR